MSEKFDQELDCSGLACPMPILKTKKAVDGLNSGEVLKMTATDPGSLPDVQAWTAKTGHELVSHAQDGDKFIFYIKKK
ncbi:MAG: sulfurtransferase TusA family protein [Anaerolineae bacterium]|jgi:tRNA 2-thiouridine synthesizing protein A|nr:sulfurtransferase TusA family protein [Anaerolineae bacterium]